MSTYPENKEFLNSYLNGESNHCPVCGYHDTYEDKREYADDDRYEVIRACNKIDCGAQWMENYRMESVHLFDCFGNLEDKSYIVGMRYE